jgi:hypothetical protein
MKKFKNAIRFQTRRSNGHSLPKIISNLNGTLRGWYEYFKQVGKQSFRRWMEMSVADSAAFFANGHGVKVTYVDWITIAIAIPTSQSLICSA